MCQFGEVITTQKVMFYTFNTLCFEHFLCSNWPKWPNWHIKYLARLLISVCDKFCCFWRLYILKIGIQLKHEEINSNSELQSKKGIKQNQKKEAAATLPIFQGLRNFSQPP